MLHQAISSIVPAYSRKLPLPGLFSLARKS
jgi:hypothetical protein